MSTRVMGRLFCYREGDVKAHSLLAVEWHQSKSFESCRGRLAGDPSGEAASAPPLGELLSECEAEGVYCVGCCRLIVSTAPVGEALSLPQRRSRLGSPPGGVAERSESFKIMIAGGNHSTVKSWQPERAD